MQRHPLHLSRSNFSYNIFKMSISHITHVQYSTRPHYGENPTVIEGINLLDVRPEVMRRQHKARVLL